MKSVFLIFCEGQTEEVYIDMLRQRFHSPIRIVTSVQGQQMSKRIIDSYKKTMQISPQDEVTTFLMYDMDVEAVLPRLQACNAELLLSNPSIELWFLLHNADQHAALSTDKAILQLQKSAPEWKNYHKAHLSEEQINILWNKQDDAILRAKALQNYNNPSSSVYILLEKIRQSTTTPQP